MNYPTKSEILCPLCGGDGNIEIRDLDVSCVFDVLNSSQLLLKKFRTAMAESFKKSISRDFHLWYQDASEDKGEFFTIKDFDRAAEDFLVVPEMNKISSEDIIKANEVIENLNKKRLIKEISNLRSKIYNELPTGEISAFELTKIIKWIIRDLDSIIENYK